ncbi:phosphinothricin acetyltransferase [Phycisphaerales bacterium]|nr:phosphinothricin acetyltransferase [Phycisphaerales bacterium]
MPAPLIRPATVSDFPAIAALTNHFIANTTIHFGTTPVTADELTAAWLQSRDTYPQLVAELDGRFAGFAKAYRWREREAYAKTAEVGIYILLDLHRRGVGRALYSALLDDCRTRGFHTAIGGIALPNEPSIRLHEKLGFTHIGTFRECGYKHGAWRDVAFYQMMLG